MIPQVDPRNDSIQVWVGDRLYARAEAKVSVFDSSVQGGDAVWEGLRVYDGRIFAFDDHLTRLQDSAHALMFQDVPSKDDIRQAVFATLKANRMRDGVHIRLTLTRGIKVTSGMDPRLNRAGCTLIVLAEWKKPIYPEPLTLITSSIRRNTPMCLDSKIHHNNLLNNILAKIEANNAGADGALMLDIHGFIAETNDCNVFMARGGMLMTPHADACLPGITRRKVIEIATAMKIPVHLKNLSLTEIYNADEVFLTGTIGELARVAMIDGRRITDQGPASLLDSIQREFRSRTLNEGEKLPF